MKGAQIASVLSRTLSPATIGSSSQQLQSMRCNRGFTVELLVICDSLDYNPSIRQSAIIYLKNVIQDHCQRSPCIPFEDLEDIKKHLLEAIIRNVTNKQLAPTLRQIVFQMAEKYYPKEWPQIVDEALLKLTNTTDFNEILGCVETLRAVFSVFGGSIMKEIQLSNLCNKAILPLFGLASNLFQSFSAETSIVLLSVLKLFGAAIQFHLPAIVQVNIHNLMIFVKKVLDLSVVLDDSYISIYQLKRVSLRILFRIYQRHANPKLTENPQFASQFHAKYTRSFVQSLVYQVLFEGGEDKATRRRHMELMKMSLSCLAYINRQSPEAATLLIQHRNALISLCLKRMRLSFSRTYQSYVDFKMSIHENRVHLKQFFFSLMRCEALPDQQASAVSSLLQLLLNCLQKGDSQLKQLVLYIFSEMSTEIQFLSSPLDDKMTLLIVSEVMPLLKEDQHLLVRMRACQLIASYNYLDLPVQCLIDMATAVYNCLLVKSRNNQKEAFLNINACNAFNSLLKYPSIVEFVKPYLQDILKIYTSLLEADVSIIKNFEDLLNLLEEEIAPFANDLVMLLVGLFHTYSKQDATIQQLAYGASTQEDDDGDDDESACEEDDSNNESIAKACVSSIRQILQADKTILNENARKELFDIVVGIFCDRSQLFIEQGYNILNLLLYKLTGPVEDKYYIFFRVISYAILGLPNNFLEGLHKGNDFQRQYAEILENICVEPDNDLVENCIGCLRNFIAKSPPQALYGVQDDFGCSLLENIFRIVKVVHENENQRSSQTDRLIVLTLYITLIEHRVLDEHHLAQVLGQVLKWMQMEQQAMLQQNNTSSAGYIYSSVYIQIIMLALHTYGKNALAHINPHFVVQRLIFLQNNFKCDYELARVLIGIADLLGMQAVTEESIVWEVMGVLPELVRRICNLRVQGDNQLNDLEMDDEAEEERFMGNDQNSMMLGWNQRPAPTDKDLQLQEDEDDDNDWEEEFNKFYDSPLDKIDQIKWLENAIKGNASSYCAFMSPLKQQELALYFANAPLKDQ